MNGPPKPQRTAPLLLLWLIVLIELLSPVPAFLTFGAAWVLLLRPPWFLELVRTLYAGAGTPGEGGGPG